MNFVNTSYAALATACALLSLSAVADEDYRHTVRRGETLIGIGNDMLRDARHWRKLQAINRVVDPYRLMPGSTLRIPVELLRLEPAEARVTAASGDVHANGKALKAGDNIAGKARIVTGEQGFVTLELIDGSSLVLQPDSRMKVEELARRRHTTLPETQLRLESGRLESTITKSAVPRPKYIIHTPTAAIGVRGTSFRVGTDAASGASRTEVTDGAVDVRGGAKATAAVAAGYGVVTEAGASVPAPTELLVPPDLGGLPALHERTIVRFAVPPLAGAQTYRFQVGADAAMHNPLADKLAAAPEAKFGDLPDGEYTLRVRGIDARGLEGQDADLRFKLKAHPEPPFAAAPIRGAKLRAESVALSWTRHPEAAHYRIQLAGDESFAQPLADIDGIKDTTITPVAGLAPGDYFWRARSIRADGDTGPWGDAQRFLLRPLPANPEPPKIDEHELSFAWSGEPGQTFLFQFARDAQFTHMVSEQSLDQATTSVARPEAGTYYMRVRATDADGFVGPFTNAQRIDVPIPVPPWWVPLLILLPAAL